MSVYAEKATLERPGPAPVSVHRTRPSAKLAASHTDTVAWRLITQEGASLACHAASATSAAEAGTGKAGFSHLKIADEATSRLVAAIKALSGQQPAPAAKRRNIGMPKAASDLSKDLNEFLAATPLPAAEDAAAPRVAAGSTAPADLDSHLVRLVTAWPRLPARIRDAISAMAGTAGKS